MDMSILILITKYDLILFFSDKGFKNKIGLFKSYLKYNLIKRIEILF